MTPRVGVVGHVEWADFAVVGAVPEAGAILSAREHFAAPAGGGAVAAVVLRELAGSALFITAVGQDVLGTLAVSELRERGVDVDAAVHSCPQRRVVTLLDDDCERTILILGERVVPLASDDLSWNACAEIDGVYFCAGDSGAAGNARSAGVLVASPRAADALQGVRCDVLVCSAGDPDELAWAQQIDADVRLFTESAAGGRYEARDGATGRWDPAALPGPPVDSYGCGDHFAAGVTFGLASGLAFTEALVVGARAGAECMTRRGPYAS